MEYPFRIKAKKNTQKQIFADLHKVFKSDGGIKCFLISLQLEEFCICTTYQLLADKHGQRELFYSFLESFTPIAAIVPIVTSDRKSSRWYCKPNYNVIQWNPLIYISIRENRINEEMLQAFWVFVNKDLYLVRSQKLISCKYEIRLISCLKTFKSDNSRKKLHFHRVRGGAISYKLCKIRRISRKTTCQVW